MNHEMPAEANRAVAAEAYRLTRTGGYYYPIDFQNTGEKYPAFSQYRRWWDHRWNYEPWSLDFVESDFDSEIENAGFEINRETPPAMPGFGARHAVKT
jgi:hypothetical protein